MGRRAVVASLTIVTWLLAQGAAQAQGRDSLLNGTLIGATIGAGAGVAFTYATRDSDLTFRQYAYGAAVFGAIGAGIGLGVDALLSRAARIPSKAPRRIDVAPTMWPGITGVAINYRW
jgi:hypothetical protein